MRKTFFLFIFILMFFLGIFYGNETVGEGVPRIFASLEEALPRPGSPVLLVFFSTDCVVCWEDLFEMKYFIEENHLPIQLIGVTRDPLKDVESFLKKYSFSSPVVCDRKRELYRRFRVSLEPFRVVIRDGEIEFRDDDLQEFQKRKERIKKWLLETNCE